MGDSNYCIEFFLYNVSCVMYIGYNIYYCIYLVFFIWRVGKVRVLFVGCFFVVSCFLDGLEDREVIFFYRWIILDGLSFFMEVIEVRLSLLNIVFFI